MDESTFWLVFIIVMVFLIVIFIVKYGIPSGYSRSATLTGKQIKDYFFIKHYCKVCGSRLKRISIEEYKGRGWSSSMEPVYGDKYEVTFFLKCPNCNQVYSSEDI